MIDILFEKEYFGFYDRAEKYVRDIYRFISNVPQLRHRKAKNPKYGVYYCRYKVNNRTTWFVTFDKGEKSERFIIRIITNYHGSDYPSFISGIIN